MLTDSVNMEHMKNANDVFFDVNKINFGSVKKINVLFAIETLLLQYDIKLIFWHKLKFKSTFFSCFLLL